MLQTQCYGSRYTLTNKQTNKQTDFYNLWPPTRLGLITNVLCCLGFTAGKEKSGHGVAKLNKKSKDKTDLELVSSVNLLL